MSQKSLNSQSNRFTKPRVILIFGEDTTDCNCLKHLVLALRPNDVPPIEAVKRPIILKPLAKGAKRNKMCQEILNAVKAKNVTSDVVSVIAHRDCDEVEPAHTHSSANLLKDMRAHSLPQPVAATPAFEIETWWFLWPDAVAKTRSCWQILKPRGQVGTICNAKKELRRALRPGGGAAKCPDYTESDSVKIAEHVKVLGIARVPKGHSASFTDFVTQIDCLKL